MKQKYILLILILSLPVLLLSGCWDRQEPEDRALIVVAGYDYNPERELFQLFLQITTPQGGEDGGQQNENPPYWTVSAWGHTPIEALANIRKKVSRTLFYSHLNLLVISDTLVEEKGLIPVMDALSRSRQSRPIVQLAIAKEDVEEILNSDFPIEPDAGKGLINLILFTEQELKTAIVQNGKDILNKLTTPGIEPISIYLKLLEEDNEDTKEEKKEKEENEEGDDAENDQLQEDTPPRVKVDGLAAFRNNIMTGKLKDNEALGWNLITGQSDVSLINITYPSKNNTEADKSGDDTGDDTHDIIRSTIRTKRSRQKIIPVIDEQNQPAIEIKLSVEGRIIDFTGPVSLKEESEITRSLERRLAEAVRNKAYKAVYRAQELKSDIFGFGNAFFRLKHDRWQDFEKNWPEIFQQLYVDIQVEATITRSGMVNEGLIQQWEY